MEPRCSGKRKSPELSFLLVFSVEKAMRVFFLSLKGTAVLFVSKIKGLSAWKCHRGLKYQNPE